MRTSHVKSIGNIHWLAGWSLKLKFLAPYSRLYNNWRVASDGKCLYAYTVAVQRGVAGKWILNRRNSIDLCSITQRVARYFIHEVFNSLTTGLANNADLRSMLDEITILDFFFFLLVPPTFVSTFIIRRIYANRWAFNVPALLTRSVRDKLFVRHIQLPFCVMCT